MIGISACLLGLNCRYDGKEKRDSELLNSLDCSKIYPFCPEVNILGSPREAIDLYKIDNKIEAIGRESKKNYTKLLENEAIRYKKLNPDIKTFYLKSKSPSCALFSAKLYNEKGDLIDENSIGIFAKKLKELYKDAKFIERS